MRLTLKTLAITACRYKIACLLVIAGSAVAHPAPLKPVSSRPTLLCEKKTDELFSCTTDAGSYAICKQSGGKKPLIAEFISIDERVLPNSRTVEPILTETLEHRASGVGAKATAASLQFSTKLKKVRINYELSATDGDSASLAITKATDVSGMVQTRECLGEPTINDYVFTNYSAKK